MPAYVIVQITIGDPALYEEYMRLAPLRSPPTPAGTSSGAGTVRCWRARGSRLAAMNVPGDGDRYAHIATIRATMAITTASRATGNAKGDIAIPNAKPGRLTRAADRGFAFTSRSVSARAAS